MGACMSHTLSVSPVRKQRLQAIHAIETVKSVPCSLKPIRRPIHTRRVPNLDAYPKAIQTNFNAELEDAKDQLGF